MKKTEQKIAILPQKPVNINPTADESFTRLADEAVIGIFRIKTDDQLMMVNSEMARLYGYSSADEMITMAAENVAKTLFVYPEEFNHFKRLVTEHKRVNQFEVLQLRKDRSYFWVRIDAYAVLGESRNILYFQGFISDISEQKQTENWLYQKYEYLAALQETILEFGTQLDLDALFDHIVNRAGALLDASSGFLDLVDWETRQLILHTGWGILAESLNAYVNPGDGLAGKIWESGKPIVVEDYDSWSGRITDFSQNAIGAAMGVPLLYGKEVVGVLGLAYKKSSGQVFQQDAVELLTQFARFAVIAIENARLYSTAQRELAERRQAEEGLRKWAHIFEHAEWGICVSVTHELTLDLMNPAFASMHGESVVDLVCRPLLDIIAPEQRINFPEQIKLVYEKGHLTFETVNLRKDGSRFPAIVDITVVKDDDGQVLYRVINVQDISGYKHIQEELSKLNTELEQRVLTRTKQLEESNRELESFAYSVSHDLRSPLRIINGYSNILLEDYLAEFSPEAKEYVLRMDVNTKRMGKLIDDLLSFSRMGRKALERQKVFPENLVRQVWEELEGERQNRMVEICINDLPFFYADPELLRLVYENLISNALKFTRRREEARIEVGFIPYGSLPEMTRLTLVDHVPGVYYVKDNGVGFDMLYVDKLFGVFQRLHSVNDYEGTGVGLANVQRIIKRHGGRVWAEAEVERGATFYFFVDGSEAG